MSGSNDGSNRPVHTVRYQNIKAAIWRNQTANGVMYNVTLTRSYKDGEEWKDTQSFGFDDLLVVAKATTDAYEWIANHRNDDRPPPQQQQQRGGQGASRR